MLSLDLFRFVDPPQWSEHPLTTAVLRSLALRQPREGQPNWRVPGRGGAWAKRVLASFEAALEAARRGEVAAPLGA